MEEGQDRCDDRCRLAQSAHLLWRSTSWVRAPADLPHAYRSRDLPPGYQKKVPKLNSKKNQTSGARVSSGSELPTNVVGSARAVSACRTRR